MTKSAKKPKTEITAIAQWGKDELSLLFCTLPVGLNVDEEESDSPVDPDVEDERDEVEDIEESTESA